MGPHPQPWPTDPRLDPALLEHGDCRNVIDRYRYWSVEAIVADLDARRHPFHVAMQNWHRDPNIGAVVRNANAFGAAGVHIVGRHRWNRRGAMKTEAYMHLHHHDDIDPLVRWCRERELPLVGIDNLPSARPLHEAELPRACVLLLGEEGRGLSQAAQRSITSMIAIEQYGSTRSINAGAASAVVMAEWCRRHAAATRSAPAAAPPGAPRA